MKINIETKFNIGDTAYYISNFKQLNAQTFYEASDEIFQINICNFVNTLTKETHNKIFYCFNNSKKDTIEEKFVFNTLKECQKVCNEVNELFRAKKNKK